MEQIMVTAMIHDGGTMRQKVPYSFPNFSIQNVRGGAACK
jgi:hypothetical protein